LVRLAERAREGNLTAFSLALMGLIVVAVVAVIIFFERGQRRIPVQYAKRVVGRKMFGGQSTHLPLKVNTAGVIPPIFASSILMFPQQIASFLNNSFARAISDALHPGDWRYNVLYVGLIIFFCYFYTAITFDPDEVADNMKKYGGFIPSYRAGKPTERYLGYVLSRLTLPGSLYLAIIAMIPTLAIVLLNTSQKFVFGGTSILIIVGVGLDTVKQVESQLQQRNYEGFLR
jgi:preprotein translocase subunit SecY